MPVSRHEHPDTGSGVAAAGRRRHRARRTDGRFAPAAAGRDGIAEAYQVNRHTVRRALATLAERGLVRAERGSGLCRDPAPRLSLALADVFPKSSEPAAANAANSSMLTRKEPRASWRGSGLKTGAPDPDRSVRLADRAPICVSTTFRPGNYPTPGGFANVRSMTKLLARPGIRIFVVRRPGSAPVSSTRPTPRLDLGVRSRGRQHRRRYRR
jgi:GntR family phosphonate transport system transcriptional regulator